MKSASHNLKSDIQKQKILWDKHEFSLFLFSVHKWFMDSWCIIIVDLLYFDF